MDKKKDPHELVEFGSGDDQKTLIDTELIHDDGSGEEPSSVSMQEASAAPSDEDEATRAVELPVPAAAPPGAARPEERRDSGAQASPDEEQPEKTVLLKAPLFPEPPPAEGPKARLIVQFGNDRGREFPLSGRSVSVGRALDADIVLNDPSVSRKHFEIHYRDDRFVLRDLGSVNGTRVGGNRVEGEIVLEEGARIEAGQTLMTFTSDLEKTRAIEPAEVAPDEAKTVIAESPVIEPVRVKPPPKIEVSEPEPARRGPSAAALIAGAVVVILVGVLVAQFVFGVHILPFGGEGAPKGPTPEEQAAAARARDEARAFEKKGKAALDAADWDGAIEAFEKALGLDPTLEEASRALDRAREERRNAEAVAKGRSLLEQGSVQEAIQTLARVPDTSASYAQAQELTQKAREQIVTLAIEKIRSLLKEKKKSEAKDAYLKLLEEQPANERVLALRKELEAAGIRLEPPPVEARPSAPVPPRPRASRLDIEEALALYNRGAFRDAADSLRSGATGAPKGDAAKALELASRIEKFAAAYQDGKQALQANRLDQAEGSLNSALRVDHEVNGHYESEVRGLLGQTYRRRAATAIQNTDYRLAAKSARRALTYNPSDRTAQEILDKCVAVAAKLADQARADLQAGRKDEARSKAQTVLDIAADKPDLAAKAREILDQTR